MARAISPRPFVLLVTAAASLALTATAWISAGNEAEQEARLRFEARAVEITREIQGRMLDYEQVLRGAVGLFAASKAVEREEWAAYVHAARIRMAYPGILGVGYAPFVRRKDLEELESRARTDGLAGYRVFPPGEREAYAPVLYLQPVEEPNVRALGFDMYSEPLRRLAMDAARESGEPAATGVVTLIQDAAAGTVPGFLLYMPVYRNGSDPANPAQRRVALQGFVYGAFRGSDLIAGITGRAPGLELTLSDVTDASAPALLFDSTAAPGGRSLAPAFARSEEFRVHGRVWRLACATLPAFEADLRTNRPRVVLAGGLAISALLLVIVWTLLTTREQAREMARNITAALRASEERLQLALTSSNVALFDWNVESGLVHLSSAWPAMLGGAPAESDVPAQKLMLLVHPEDAPAVRAQIEALVKGAIDSYSVQHRVRRLDGRWSWIESVARVNSRSADGRALRITGANTDINERKAIEQMKAEFIATVSHELRTPLTSMLASLALIREGAAGELAPQARKFIDTAYANSERLAGLVNDILDMEKIESGRMPIRLQPVDLGEQLAEAAALNTPYAGRFGVHLRVDCTPGLRASADPERLQQVLANLISNAAKFSPAGAEVLVRAAPAADAAHAARVEVVDHGGGIPEEFRPRIFEKFSQADYRDGRQKGGTGLGLAITKALVERMQGRIGFDTGAGGSTFWVELPRVS